MSDELTAFWSYAHEDNRADRGRLLQLATDIQDEYTLLTGRVLEIFVDRDGIEWGNRWRRRIDESITQTAFLIPVMTPRYFTREECRKEVLAFTAKARALDAEELILPILYTPVEGLEGEATDEVVTLLSKYQHVDWTELRLKPTDSEEYRNEVHDMAIRLRSAQEAIREKQVKRELEDVGHDEINGVATLEEALARIQAHLVDFVDALNSHRVTRAQFRATWDVYSQRLEKLERSGGRPGARFAVMQQIVRDELPIAQRAAEAAKGYAASAIDMDPSITQALALIREHPEEIGLLSDLGEALSEVEENFNEAEAFQQEWQDSWVPAEEWARKRAHIARSMGALADTWMAAREQSAVGNEIVLRWIEEWRKLGPAGVEGVRELGS